MIVCSNDPTLNWYLISKNKMTNWITVYYHRVPFSRATSFVDFVDFLTSTKFVSPKIIINPIVTWIAD